jgi:hypothetical protein
MSTSEHKYLSDFAQRYYGEGEAKGVVKATRDAVLTVLAARGLAVSEADRARVEACSDAVTLGRWHVRAVSAATTSDVFED